MKNVRNDREKANVLVERFGLSSEKIGYEGTELSKLDLSGLTLTHIPPEVWDFGKLKHLYLNNNKLTGIPEEVGMLSLLETLHVYNNKLNVLHDRLWELVYLVILRLDNNSLDYISEGIAQLTALQRLDLDQNQLTRLPAEIGYLTSLQRLDLDQNQLTHVPAEIGQLTSLQQLSLSQNQLTHVPAELWQLTSLQRLDLHQNQLTHVPAELGQLTSLQQLYLHQNRFTRLPAELWQLTSLQHLYLHENQLTQVPAEIGQLTSLQQLSLSQNQLTRLPAELWQLTSLQHLYLHENQLTEVPAEIGQLTSLQWLNLSQNQLTEVPAEIGHLTSLQHLFLDQNRLTQVPTELSRLNSLQRLDLDRNQLTQVPAELRQLTSLQRLYLSQNQLTQVPTEISQLASLQELYLNRNQLTQVPLDLGNLHSLQKIDIDFNSDILTPPPEIVARGTQDILAFLRELQKSSVQRYEAKLVVVGEGGTGKSSLIKALRGEIFDSSLSTTHGIEVSRLALSHLSHEVLLNIWDFGGQHIYHATHQFFLTKRSLYLLVWNARLGAEQGRLAYWLETIKALAPDAPILLVATHIDERSPDLNYQRYKTLYPQLTGNVSVSNKEDLGITDIKSLLAQEAFRLPLMGQPWPQKWLEMEQRLLASSEKHISADRYIRDCESCEIEKDIARGTLASYLHDLGRILYFRDDYILSNLVILKPNWVTRAISRVLDDEQTSVVQGVLPYAELPRIWDNDEDGEPYEPYLYPVLLRLMERFELTYQIESENAGDLSTASLIPQLLPHQPPIELPPWPNQPPDGQSQVEIIYRLDFVPAGIMSRFIVRTHRYTRGLHWREGVLLEYQNHQARVELNPTPGEIRIFVQGTSPQNFFVILMNTVDVILAHFEGLLFRREIPCICHWQQPASQVCTRFYRYEDLVRRIEAGRHTVECPDTLQDVSLPLLLYGIHSSTHEQVMSDIQQGQQRIQQELKELKQLDSAILQKLDQQSELIARSFARQWNLEMQKMEAECPNIFVLLAGSTHLLNPKNWISRDYRLYLLCQHLPGPHRVGEGYRVRKGKEWWNTLQPWLNLLITFLKFGVPMGHAIGAVYDAAALKEIQETLSLVEEIIKDIPEFIDMDTAKTALQAYKTEDQQHVNSSLRAFHTFLKEIDPAQTWGNLCKIVTPDGNILWLCEDHRKQYESKQVKLDS